MSTGGNVNIIGAGLAGLSAALTLAKEGIHVNLISSAPSERAQSVMAEGGTNAVLNLYGENDTVEEHFADTMRGGCFIADEEAVRNLVTEAPQVIKELAAWGVPFSYEDGHIAQRYFGGQKKRRTAYIGSATGKMLMSALIDRVQAYEEKGLITRYAHHYFADLLTDDDQGCSGVRIRDAYTGEALAFEGCVLIASGGLNGLFSGYTTGTEYNTGDVTAALFARGILLSNLEMIQYHPTTVPIPGKRMLLTEAARGEGGRLFAKRDGERWYFMEEKYPELKNLMPRDVVTREIWKVKKELQTEDVFLDMTALSVSVWENKLRELREDILFQLNFDPAKEPVRITPGIHYFMGGIDVDAAHRTSMQGLYAAGECCSLYHGANRLGANSTMAAMVGGRIAGRSMMKNLASLSNGEVRDEHFDAVLASPSGGGVGEADGEGLRPRASFTKTLSDTLYAGLNIVRDEETMRETLDKLTALEAEAANDAEKRKALLGRAMVLCALERKESRGAHTRSDYPETSDAYKGMTKVRYRDGEIICGLS